MKTAILALLGMFLLSTTADAGLFRRRCVSRAKAVHRDCCGNVVKVKVVTKSRCCPQPCCPTKPACCPSPAPCCPQAAPEAPVAPQGQVSVSGDQYKCHVKAQYMARTGLSGHPHAGVGMIGRFEGTGWSTGGTPGTCTPSRGMRLSGDATACANGRCVRVRSWR